MSITEPTSTPSSIPTDAALAIRHRVGVVSPSAMDVYDVLTTIDGLARWWTTETTGDPTYGGTIRFDFDRGFFEMAVIETEPGKKVRWRVVDGPAEWIDTTIDWRLVREGEQTTVLFAHEGWREPVEFMSHCSMKWATFLLSLKALIETGAGSPAPHDFRIDNFDTELRTPLSTSAA